MGKKSESSFSIKGHLKHAMPTEDKDGGKTVTIVRLFKLTHSCFSHFKSVLLPNFRDNEVISKCSEKSQFSQSKILFLKMLDKFVEANSDACFKNSHIK